MTTEFLRRLQSIKNGTKEPDPVKVKKPIAKRSVKTKDSMKEYEKIKKAFLVNNLRCKAMVECKGAITEDIHHMAGRGKNLTNESTWLPVCRKCHRWIHDNHGKAKELGLIKSKAA